MSIKLGANTNQLTGDAGNGGPPGAGRDQPTEPSVRTQSEVSIPTQSGDLGVSNVAGNSHFFTRGAIFKGRWPWLLDESENLTSHLMARA